MSAVPVKLEPQSVTVATPTMMDLLTIAVQKGDIDTIERLAALYEKSESRQSEIAFNAALNRAQSAMGPVAADLTNPQTKSRYASYAAIDKRVRPIYSKEGLALSFDTGESPSPDVVRVVCHVSHSSGHTRTYHVDMPSDGKGAKGGDVMTKTHATGAAMSYGMRYLVKFIFNIAVGEDDTDGNMVSNGELAESLDWIASAKDVQELQKLFTDAYKKAQAARNQGAMQAIINAKNKRKAELGVK